MQRQTMRVDVSEEYEKLGEPVVPPPVGEYDANDAPSNPSSRITLFPNGKPAAKQEVPPSPQRSLKSTKSVRSTKSNADYIAGDLIGDKNATELANDLVTLFGHKESSNSADHLKTLFRLTDRDGDGYITATELTTLVRLVDALSTDKREIDLEPEQLAEMLLIELDHGDSRELVESEFVFGVLGNASLTNLFLGDQQGAGPPVTSSYPNFNKTLTPAGSNAGDSDDDDVPVKLSSWSNPDSPKGYLDPKPFDSDDDEPVEESDWWDTPGKIDSNPLSSPSTTGGDYRDPVSVPATVISYAIPEDSEYVDVIDAATLQAASPPPPPPKEETPTKKSPQNRFVRGSPDSDAPGLSVVKFKKPATPGPAFGKDRNDTQASVPSQQCSFLGNCQCPKCR